MHFMYMGKILFHLSVCIQKTGEKVRVTFGDTTVSGMGQPVLHGFRGLHGFTGRGRGRPSILTGNPISLHVSDCNVLGLYCIFLNVSLKQLLFNYLFFYTARASAWGRATLAPPGCRVEKLFMAFPGTARASARGRAKYRWGCEWSEHPNR